MNSTTFHAFSNELTKTALLQSLKNGLIGTVREGWHGSPEQIAAGEGATWFGKGRQITPGMGRGARMLEEFTSLGGATRALPIGSKSMMVLGTGLMARDAFRPTDPTGQGRSRTERVTGLAGNTVGGLVGSAIGNRIRPGMMGSLVGGVLGGLGAEKAITAPFARRGNAIAQPQNPYLAQPYDGGVPA